MTTQLKQTYDDTTTIYNDAWVLDEARSKRWQKPIYVTSLGQLEEHGIYDPWYDEIPKGATFWYGDADKTTISVLSHKTKSPSGDKVGLVVLNMSFTEEEK
tara:strand:- start:1463 stop:1765 length:303 start_codon:yes stop_codon:yes gene_type:complete